MVELGENPTTQALNKGSYAEMHSGVWLSNLKATVLKIHVQYEGTLQPSYPSCSGNQY